MGYIKLFRKLREWEWYGEPSMLALWVHLLLRANWEDAEWRGIPVPRGSFVASLSALAAETGLSVSQIRLCLKRLAASGQITVQSSNKYTLVTICKYEEYQVTQQDETAPKQPANNPKTTPPPAAFQFRAALIDLGVEPNIADDWLKVRKSKKGVNTETAFKAIEREIKKAIEAGYTANDCILLATEKSWIGFKFEWAANEWGRTRQQAPPAQQGYDENQFLARNFLEHEGVIQRQP